MRNAAFITEVPEDTEGTEKSESGPIRFFVCEAGVSHRSASGLVKRLPNMMANWFAAGLQ